MRRLSDLADPCAIRPGNRTEPSFVTGSGANMAWLAPEKKRVHLFALGDVGSLLLTGLRLLGGDCLSRIGIYDVREHVGDRFEFEMNQVADPSGKLEMPAVEVLCEEQLFDCDLFLFCASLRVPPVGEGGDVRMAQLSANAGLVRSTAEKAVQAGYPGLFCVVSDPVDPLCRIAMEAGIPAERVKGFGLGVMAARAAYYAGKDARFRRYLTEGRAYGPHGEDLVIADSLVRYDDILSRELTEKAVRANLQMREWGFKPFMAPALSSGALSVLALLRGEWHYSSTWFGDAYFGAWNRCTASGIEVENPDMPEALFLRCRTAYDNLTAIRA